MTNNCACSFSGPVEYQNVLSELGSLRTECVVLRNILCPDELWDMFRTFHEQRDYEAEHRSIVILALMRGYLANLTVPLHRFLISDGTVANSLKNQYKRDLSEMWFKNETAFERHRSGRRFLGKLVELVFAFWLEEKGWKICGLEALVDGPDISAFSTSSQKVNFEVKYIGTTDEEFISICNSLSGSNSVIFTSPYSLPNFTLFKVFESSKQLVKYCGPKISVIIITEMSMDDIENPFITNWIDWTNPHFLTPDQEFESFLDTQANKYPNVATDVTSYITRNIDEVWILELKNDFSLKLIKEERMHPI